MTMAAPVRRAGLALGADGAEQIGAAGAQVGDLARSRSALGPDPGALGLLADAHLVPRLREGRLWNQISTGVPGGWPARISAIRCEKFFERLQRRLILAVVSGPGGDVRELQPLQQLADGALVVVDTPALGDQRRKVGAAPARQVAQTGRGGTRLPEPLQLGLLLRRQPPRAARRGPVHQARRPLIVEPALPSYTAAIASSRRA